MKLYKAILALLVCLCMAFPAVGFAAEGDAVLARRNYETGEGFQDYINYTVTRGDELVLIGGEAVYTWHVGEADLTAYPWDTGTGNGLYSYESIEDEDGAMTNISRSALAAYSDGEEVYIVVGEQILEEDDGYFTFEGASLAKIVLEEGKAKTEPVEESEIDWEELIEYYEEESYPRSLERCVYADGVLYGVTYGASGMEAYAIPTDGGYSAILEDITEPQAIATYKDGKILFMLYDYTSPDSLRFVTWDNEAEEMEELCSLATEMYLFPSGIAYDEQADRIVYSLNGSVIRLNPETGETEEVNDMPSGMGGNTSLMLPGGYFVQAGYDAVIVRNTDPSQKAEYRLSVNNGNYAEPINAAYYDFTNIRGDVSVAVSTEYQQSSAVIEAMMNQSTDYDIYVLATSEEAFASVYNRGYMADLSGSEKIKAYFDDLYPDIAAQLSLDGAPVAIPLTCYGNAFGVNLAALEKAGLTIEEIPTNWADLLDQLDELAAKVEGKGVSLFYNWYTAQDMKNNLFGMIFQDYIHYMNRTDPTMGFNTELLRGVLEKLDAVDFVALGLMEDREDEEYAVNYSVDDSAVLFETYVGATIGEFYGSYHPILLSLTADSEPVLKLSVATAFVNPYSENIDLAIEYLECAIDNINFAQRASLCDVEIEPKRSSYYEEAKENAQKELDDLKKSLDEAEEGEKQTIEEMIKDTERWLEDIETSYWDISPDAIEWYRANDDSLALETFNILYSGDTYSEISEYIMQYYAGEIGPEQMLAGIDSKLQMMLLEGN